jgi:hypothetical protein
VDPTQPLTINPKSDLKITNICLSDTLQHIQEDSRVSLALDGEPICVFLLKPFQVFLGADDCGY